MESSTFYLFVHKVREVPVWREFPPPPSLSTHSWRQPANRGPFLCFFCAKAVFHRNFFAPKKFTRQNFDRRTSFQNTGDKRFWRLDEVSALRKRGKYGFGVVRGKSLTKKREKKGCRVKVSCERTVLRRTLQIQGVGVGPLQTLTPFCADHLVDHLLKNNPLRQGKS